MAELKSKALKNKEKRAEKLLDEACAIIADQGLSALSARVLADKIGCSVGSIYNVYDDLDDLIMRANSRTLVDLGMALTLTQSIVLRDDPLKRLLTAARIYLDFCQANPRRWAAIFEHSLAEGRDIPSWHLEDHYRLFVFIKEPIADLKSDMSDEDLTILARSLFSGVHGIISLGRQIRLKALPHEVIWKQVELIVTSFVKGFADI